MKTPPPRQRWLILGTLLFATVAAAFFVEDDPAAPAERQRPAKNESRPRPQAVDVQSPRVSLAQAPAIIEPAIDNGEGEESTETVDPFRSKSWYVAPPPPPPPKPVAPPLPFQFLGQLIEEDGTRVFVNHQGRHLIIKAGDIIAGSYAVEEIDAGKVVFLYLPLKERQVLAIGTS